MRAARRPSRRRPAASGAQRAVEGEHRRRDDVQRHLRRDLDHLQLHGQPPRENGNQYEAVFTNSVGTATTSDAATLDGGLRHHPARQPDGRRRRTVTFTAASSNPGSGDTVQWEVSTDGGTTFSAISGATSTTYSFTATAATNGDEYEAVFTNSAGTLTSNAATLTVDSRPP